jgi:hypothetical protein
MGCGCVAGHPPIANPPGQPLHQMGSAVLFGPEPCQLLVCAKDDELGNLNPVRTELTLQLIQRLLNRRGLSDSVARSSCWHKRKCNTGTHR